VVIITHTIRAQRGTQFDPRVVEALAEAVRDGV